jgi:hypothetical protein
MGTQEHDFTAAALDRAARQRRGLAHDPYGYPARGQRPHDEGYVD